MTSIASKNVWMKRQQCPCGDWKCFVTYEDESEDSNVEDTQLNNNNFNSSEAIITPYVGMIFKTDEEAFEYYGNFARKNGFSIRKERSRLSPQLGVYKRDFVCYRSGFAPLRKKSNPENHRDRKSVRCGCDAKMYLSKEIIENKSHWLIVQFSNIHNHELLEDDQVRLLPAYRKINESDQEKIILLTKAGFPIHRIVKVLELEKGKNTQLPFLERDVRNFVQNRKKTVQENDILLTEKRENDILDLLEALRASKQADSSFNYDITLDENDKIENIFWSYAESIYAYNLYGDVIYFDTNYRNITYGLIFLVFFGINNHGKVILFGCALLQDETPRSFTWALQVFLRFMNGKQPQTIITDIDLNLRDVIRNELSNTNHVISIWSINSRVFSWFSVILGGRFLEFRDEFNRLYGLESVEDFEYQWNCFVSEFGLNSDKHVGLLFSMRFCWANAYIRGFFIGNMMSISYFNYVGAFFKGVFNVQTCLRSFFEQVGISSHEKIHGLEDTQYIQLKTCLPIEEHGREILTSFAFNLLQNELISSMQYAMSEMGNGSFLLRHYKKTDEERFVIYMPEDEQIHCYCKEFESSGILCKHALRILIMKNYFQLPDKYFLRRWRKESDLMMDSDRVCGDDWFKEFNLLTNCLFNESVVCKERVGYVKSEVTRLIEEVKDMGSSDGFN